MKINEIKNKKDLAKFLNVKYRTLTYVLYGEKIESFYTTFEIPKKNGDKRTIHAPNSILRTILKKLERKLNILYEETYSKENNVVQAFVKGKSFISNAEKHRNKKFLINIDLENFFDSFHFGRVKGFFEKDRLFSLPNDVSLSLAQLACYNGVLPQGSPASPVITNFIFRIVDKRIMFLTKKYKLSYTRYADDLTFSTNNKKIVEQYDMFISELTEIIKKSGFTINENKTNFQYSSSRQEVTGLVVNEKVNCKREYYKETKSMALSLYKNGEFTIKGEKGTINQLEGRFSFINQIEKYNNIKKGKSYKNNKLSSKENEFKKFLFYRYFLTYEQPILITEGKTDIRYLKAALMNLYKDYPQLIIKNGDRYIFKIKFLIRSERFRYFFKLNLDGADTIYNIYNLYEKEKLYDYFCDRFGIIPDNPVILIFDNEDSKEKPLNKFLKCTQNSGIISSNIKDNLYSILKENTNLFLLVNQKIASQKDTEIENLFAQDILNTHIDGKRLSLKDKINPEEEYGKEIFSKYIFENYNKIDFSNFRPMLDKLVELIDEYKNL